MILIDKLFGSTDVFVSIYALHERIKSNVTPRIVPIKFTSIKRV